MVTSAGRGNSGSKTRNETRDKTRDEIRDGKSSLKTSWKNLAMKIAGCHLQATVKTEWENLHFDFLQDFGFAPAAVHPHLLLCKVLRKHEANLKT